jgi:demethylmenaquinone methyltransferase/2-methoxy-6-polyprenyl-1,4-benzoquinol methylase
MPFRASFDCLWCGTPWTARGPEDLEGWAHLCPDCVGKAGDNDFLRFRLRAAITERGAAGSATPARADGRAAAAGSMPDPAEPRLDATSLATDAAGPADPANVPLPAADPLVAYYDARAPEYDDWYLRRGPYSHGPIHDAAWNAELDAAGRWLDGLPFRGEIVELAAGTGWWSPLLAEKGELSLYDLASAPLELARQRLVAHGLRAHLHIRDAWAEPDRQVDAVFAGFWLSHVPADRLMEFLQLVRRWLKPDGMFAFVDSLPDPQSGSRDNPSPGGGTAVRRLADGRSFEIVKVFRDPAELERALLAAGFAPAEVTATGRFFVLGRAATQPAEK